MTRLIITLVLLFILNPMTNSQKREEIESKVETKKENKVNKENKDSTSLYQLVEEIVLLDSLNSIADRQIELNSEIFDKGYKNIVKSNKEKDLKIKRLEDSKRAVDKERVELSARNEELSAENEELKARIVELTLTEEEIAIDSICTKRGGVFGLGSCKEWLIVHKTKEVAE